MLGLESVRSEVDFVAEDIQFFSLRPTPRGVRDSFNRLPADPYLHGDYIFRYRRYSTGVVRGRRFLWQESEKFTQSKSINTYAGDIKRQYPELEPSVKEFVSKSLILDRFIDSLPSASYEIGVHQMRIVADNEHMGKPAPEGIHRDGFDWIAIVPVSIDNVSGGVTLLKDADMPSQTLLDDTLEENRAMLFNDRRFLHYTSPITPLIPGEARRDVFVLTFHSKCRKGVGHAS